MSHRLVFFIGIPLALAWRLPPPRMAVSQNAETLNGRRDRLLNELADVNRALEAEEADRTISSAKVGSSTSVFEPSFGYLSRSAGVYTEAQSVGGSNLPSSAIDLAVRNFKRELPELRKSLRGDDADQIRCSDQGDCTEDCEQLRAKLDALLLSNDAVWDRERKREAAGGKVQAPLVLLAPYYFLCWCLDVFFEDRPLSRFWFLETVARMPYFSYVSMLHLYESLGWWRRSAETKRVHFAEEWNEFHHLLTMEALGGDQLWRDRFLAQHAAIAYYWILVALWLVSPSLAYNFSELIEAHAVDTYGEFVDANAELLATLPAPRVSRLYYNGPDLFLFDEFQTSRARGSRRPPCETLLDVFTNIRDDEAEHVATMKECQDPNVAVAAPRVEAAVIAAAVGVAAIGLLTSGGDGAGVGDAVSSLGDALAGAGEGGEEALDATAAFDAGAAVELGSGLAAAAAAAGRLVSGIVEGASFGLKEAFEAFVERLIGGEQP